jgi:hypothetical protein
MMADWAEEQAKANVTIKVMNDMIKKKRDGLIATGNETTRKNMITKLMGQVMAYMTAESRRMVMKWTQMDAKDPADPESTLKAILSKKHMKSLIGCLFLKQLWLLTCMLTVLWMKQQSWKCQKFDDAIEECETMGATVTDEMKIIYLMKNINEKIFEQTLILLGSVLTRKTFPDK